jgi:ABC-type transport system involved in cytochrome c biogenesis permease subunit
VGKILSWDSFIFFVIPALLLWAAGAIMALRGAARKAIILTVAGLCVFAIFIVCLWVSLERPPLRTMGETRLWYSLFLPAAGLLIYMRRRYSWILVLSTIMSAVFICVNLLKPEIHNKALMPALQSPWFAPHVIVYMWAYALLSAAALSSAYMLVRGKAAGGIAECDELMRTGASLLTIGMLFGALWAKAAWGHYWSWDPKETWAASSWAACLLYIHFRHSRPESRKAALGLVLFAFVLLQVCWIGVHYLPSAKGQSVHIYD